MTSTNRTAELFVALVNAYRSGQLIPASEWLRLTEEEGEILKRLLTKRCYARGAEAEFRIKRQGTVYTRWVRAVAEPYTAGRLLAAWEVLCGRAFAFEYPKPGDLESIIEPKP